MRFKRLSRVNDFRIFKKFDWPSGLAGFGQFNLIYGWNGSGKTTLSQMFAKFQNKIPDSEGVIEFEFDDNSKVNSTGITEAAELPKLRVFNSDFVNRTIASIEQQNVPPIYILGEDSIAKQKEIQKLHDDLKNAVDKYGDAERDHAAAIRDLDSFHVEKAKFIKEALLGSPSYANYDKRRIRESIGQIQSETSPPQILTDLQKQQLRIQKDQKPEPDLSPVTLPRLKFEVLVEQVRTTLEKSITSETIETLTKNPSLSSWVESGLRLHTHPERSDTCLFCGNEFTATRRLQLERHFNDAFVAFQSEIQGLIDEIAQTRARLRAIAPHDEARLSQDLRVEYADLQSQFSTLFEGAIGDLSHLVELLDRKKANPFDQSIEVAPAKAGSTAFTDLDFILNQLNDLYSRHNAIMLNLAESRDQACRQLERAYIADALREIVDKQNRISAASRNLEECKPTPERIRAEIHQLESEIIEHRRPAEELNREVGAYLGRNELHFEVRSTGYTLTRYGQPAVNLSEGEKTAIAFLYFLKSLETKDFDTKTGVVVIDDPVSSLDANALFSAFAYMKGRTKFAHQLFILTHSFPFFRQVKNWFHHLKGQNKKDVESRPARFYFVDNSFVDGVRTAAISPLDPLLEENETEYHFLFKRVHTFSVDSRSIGGLEACYGIPNIARRLMETFLAFRFPDVSGDLSRTFDVVPFDEPKKTRILRFLHTYSHSKGVGEPEHDPMILREANEIAKNIMELIEATDKGHFDGMIKSILPRPGPE